MKGTIIDLGLCDYDYAHSLQLQIVEQLKCGASGEHIILCEHNNSFTIGRNGSRENILVSDDYLNKEDITVRFIERGGDVTYHGPGQLVIYPILDLKQRRKDIAHYLAQLEELAIRLLAGWGLQGERIDGRRGVWVDGEKVASIGVSFRNWISFHGLAVNLNCDMKFFELIYPCGMKDRLCTSVAELLGHTVDMHNAKDTASDIVADIFNTEWIKDETFSLVA